MAAVDGDPIPAKEQPNRGRGWVEELRGKAARLGVRGIEVGWRGVAGVASDSELCLAWLVSSSSRKKKKGTGNG